ncbi:MAG: hypothetical protein BMS9Abin28_1811 [Anaerolineae bacterium]|nr:MAG: hypothetical protein BMS9Abin28_1811 [Anaerolineae bacterium]
MSRSSLLGAALILLALVVAGACWFLLQLPDRFPQYDEYGTQISQSVILNEDGETVVKGRVSHTGMGCGSGQENCHFVLHYGGWPINVYYLNSPEGETCANEEAAQHAEEINNGDEVEVFARYYAVGSLSTCDSADYYIRQSATGP